MSAHDFAKLTNIAEEDREKDETVNCSQQSGDETHPEEEDLDELGGGPVEHDDAR